MDIDTQAGDVEEVTMSDILQLSNQSWNQPRSTEQLLGFIARREAALSDEIDE